MIFCHIKRKRFVASHAKTGFKLIDQQTENCPFNTVAVCRINGSSAQKAFDDISLMVSARFAAWDQTVNMLPTWGKDVDAQVHQYIKGIQNIVQANISWRYASSIIYARPHWREKQLSNRQIFWSNRGKDPTVEGNWCAPTTSISTTSTQRLLMEWLWASEIHRMILDWAFYWPIEAVYIQTALSNNW